MMRRVRDARSCGRSSPDSLVFEPEMTEPTTIWTAVSSPSASTFYSFLHLREVGHALWANSGGGVGPVSIPSELGHLECQIISFLRRKTSWLKRVSNPQAYALPLRPTGRALFTPFKWGDIFYPTLAWEMHYLGLNGPTKWIRVSRKSELSGSVLSWVCFTYNNRLCGLECRLGKKLLLNTHVIIIFLCFQLLWKIEGARFDGTTWTYDNPNPYFKYFCLIAA